MGLVFDIILDLLFETSKGKKVPKPVRYLLILLILLLFIVIFGLIILTGIDMLENSLIGGIIVLLLGIVFLTIIMIEFRKSYIIKKNK